MSIDRLETTARMSQAVIHGGMVYLSGQVALNAPPSVAEQTRVILATIDRLLGAAGTDKSKLLTANIWLADMSTFDEMNRVWDEWVSPGNAPTRATVGAALARKDLLVEIAVTAARAT